MSARHTYLPGDRVRIIAGAATGLTGEVVSVLDASVLWMNAGRAAAPFQPRPGQVCVAITVSGVRVPLALDPSQVELEDPDPPSTVPIP